MPSSRLLPRPKGRHDLSMKKDGEPAFVVQPEIQWTFSQPEKMVSKGVSAIGTGIVVGLPLAVWTLTVRWSFSIEAAQLTDVSCVSFRADRSCPTSRSSLPL